MFQLALLHWSKLCRFVIPILELYLKIGRVVDFETLNPNFCFSLTQQGTSRRYDVIKKETSKKFLQKHSARNAV